MLYKNGNLELISEVIILLLLPPSPYLEVKAFVRKK